MKVAINHNNHHVGYSSESPYLPFPKGHNFETKLTQPPITFFPASKAVPAAFVAIFTAPLQKSVAAQPIAPQIPALSLELSVSLGCSGISFLCVAVLPDRSATFQSLQFFKKHIPRLSQLHTQQHRSRLP